MEILIASNNKNKLAEFSRIFDKYELENTKIMSFNDIGFTGDIVENGETFEDNALIKARFGASLGYVTIADDSGLCVDALGGAPGVYSARYAGEHDTAANNTKLLRELDGLLPHDRAAQFVCCIACAFPDGRFFTVRGECRGTILTELTGEGGFGYDPLFYVPELKKSFAQLTPEEKNSVSHRGLAIEKFVSEFPKYI